MINKVNIIYHNQYDNNFIFIFFNIIVGIFLNIILCGEKYALMNYLVVFSCL